MKGLLATERCCHDDAWSLRRKFDRFLPGPPVISRKILEVCIPTFQTVPQPATRQEFNGTPVSRVAHRSPKSVRAVAPDFARCD